MRILILLLFMLASPVAALWSVAWAVEGESARAGLRALLLQAKPRQLGTYFFFAAATLLLFFAGPESLSTLIISCLLITQGYMAALTDWLSRRVPNRLLLVMLGVWLFVALAMLSVNLEKGLEHIVAALIGLLIGGGLMLILYLVSRKGLGAGDVKFMAVAGLYLTYSWVLPVMFVGGVLCLLTAVVLMLMKKIKLNDALPLIPFLYVGVLMSAFLR